MKSHARVVVIGGGAVGVGTLYHLAKKGWSDVVLIERRELTSGSTWHAAGLLPLFNLSYSVGQLHKYSVELYKSLEAETGQNVGFRSVSNIRLARTQDRLDEYKYYAGVARTIGVRTDFLTPVEVKEIWPLMETGDIIGAIQHVDDGYIQPADLTQAFATGARKRGAEIYRNTTVTGITQQPNGEWLIATDKGDITCEHVVSATGNFARNTGAMVGLDIPVIPVEHQYIVTEQHPLIMERRAKGLPEMGVLREANSSWYMREEAGGLLLGPYEIGAPNCYVDGPSPQSEYELFQEDLDRLAPYIETAIERVPAFGEVGVKKVYNGAIAYTPDGSPIVGPAWHLKNFWLNEGHSFGITAAGGAGWQLAEWIVEGEPSVDMMGVDPRRFGPYAGRGYLRQKTEEAYAKVFSIHYPEEERGAARGLKRSPCYDRMAAKGAVFGTVYGWERPGWFAPQGYALTEAQVAKPTNVLVNENHAEPEADGRVRERWSFRRSNAFAFVGAEAKHVNEKVGLLDMTAFAKFEVSGPGAGAWLDSILTNKTPKPGRVSLSYLLTKRGGVRSEFTVFGMGPNSFYLVSAGALERHDSDYLFKLQPTDGSVTLQKVTTQYGVFVLAGPRSRDLLAKLTDTDLSTAAFPWLTGKMMSVGTATALAMRVNYVGELGWELHHPIEMQNYLFDLLFEAGAEFELKPFGIKAMDSLRLEKSYKIIPREMSIEYSAYESGLDRFISLKKGDFIGKDALLAWKERGLANAFVTLEVHDVTDADARGSEPIHIGSELVGRTTSGGFGWRVGKSLALAMVRPDLAVLGQALEVTILAVRYRATVIADSPFDPANDALRLTMRRLLAAGILVTGVMGAPAWADTVLHLSVIGAVTAMPDELVGQLTAQANAPTAAAAQDQVNRMVQAALAAAKPSSGVTASTTAYSVWHETDPKDVWHASQGIALRSHDGAGLLPLIGTLQSSGLAVGDLSWQLSPAASETAYEAAITKGVHALTARALKVASLLHMRFEDFRSVTVGEDGGPAPRPMMMRAIAMDKTAAPPSAQADIVTISATVSGDARLVPGP